MHHLDLLASLVLTTAALATLAVLVSSVAGVVVLTMLIARRGPAAQSSGTTDTSPEAVAERARARVQRALGQARPLRSQAPVPASRRSGPEVVSAKAERETNPTDVQGRLQRLTTVQDLAESTPRSRADAARDARRATVLGVDLGMMPVGAVETPPADPSSLDRQGAHWPASDDATPLFRGDEDRTRVFQDVETQAAGPDEGATRLFEAGVVDVLHAVATPDSPLRPGEAADSRGGAHPSNAAPQRPWSSMPDADVDGESEGDAVRQGAGMGGNGWYTDERHAVTGLHVEDESDEPAYTGPLRGWDNEGEPSAGAEAWQAGTHAPWGYAPVSNDVGISGGMPAGAVAATTVYALDYIHERLASVAVPDVLAMSLLDGMGEVLAGETDPDLTGELRSLMVESGAGYMADVEQPVLLADDSTGVILLVPTGSEMLLGALVRDPDDDGDGQETRRALRALASEIGGVVSRAS